MTFQRIRFEAEAKAVRAALLRLERGDVLAPLEDDSRAAILLALAEAMNNIAEHAYAGGAGRAVVSLSRRGGAVVARMVDQGRPAPAMCDTGRAVDPWDLPEGGFGQVLIRRIARDVAQCRRSGCNVLRLSIDANISV